MAHSIACKKILIESLWFYEKIVRSFILILRIMGRKIRREGAQHIVAPLIGNFSNLKKFRKSHFAVCYFVMRLARRAVELLR